MYEIIGGPIPFLSSTAINKETADYKREQEEKCKGFLKSHHSKVKYKSVVSSRPPWLNQKRATVIIFLRTVRKENYKVLLSTGA
jgi:hypothetical protein